MSDEVRKATVEEQAADALQIGTVFELECALRRALKEGITVSNGNKADADAAFCCHIPCDKDAEWVIMYTPFGIDEYTHSCSEHLGDMMTDAPEHRIYPIESGA